MIYIHYNKDKYIVILARLQLHKALEMRIIYTLHFSFAKKNESNGHFGVIIEF